MNFKNKKRVAAAALLIAAVFALPGCQVWDAWLKSLGFGEQPKVVGGGAAVLDKPLANNIIVDTTPLPRVRLLRVSLPAGTVSNNEKVWRQLDEDALDSNTSVMLAQNGLRAGIATVSRWPGMSKLLDVTGATRQDFVCQTDGRSPLNVVVRDRIADQIIVSVDRDNVQQGRTFEKCENAFRLSLSTLKTHGDVMVQLEPIVTFGVTPAGQPIGSEVTFLDIRLWTTIKQDQFLMVAPADPKANRYSVGTRFLSDNEKVPPTETVLVFVPIGKDE
jgi:hypothetical protein